MPTPGNRRKVGQACSLRRTFSPPSRERGGALLTVLWMSAALAAIAFSVATTVRSETDRVASSSSGLRTWYLATGSVERAIQWMMWGPDFRNPDGSARFWEPNMPRMSMHYASGDAIVELIPESSKLNINSASSDDLLRVVSAVTGDVQRAGQITQAILDWRGPASEPTLFDSYYASVSPTFRARHASFEEIEELLLVKGMTPELFYGNYIPDSNGRLFASGGLRDCLSVWGGPGPFDINTVSPALMQAVGVPLQGIAAIVAQRNLKPLRAGDLGNLGYPTPRLGIGGNFIWTMRATARLRGSDGLPTEYVRTAAAVVKLLDARRYSMAPVHVLRWYDDAWSESAIAPPAVLGAGVVGR
jgi:general secretion pathway protein K